MTSFAHARASFRKMHESFFTLPNAATAGEAIKLAAMGFPAIASTSHGLALTLGKRDYSATREETLANLRVLCTATNLPVNADFEAGFAKDPAGVAASVTMAAEVGVAVAVDRGPRWRRASANTRRRGTDARRGAPATLSTATSSSSGDPRATWWARRTCLPRSNG
jgi:hypothetical protein